MKFLRTLLAGLGLAAIAFGLLFLLQGAGIVRYPPESFMVAQTPWVWRGIGVMLAGAVAIFVARRV